jgi:heterodisulfide reductase subunit A
LREKHDYEDDYVRMGVFVCHCGTNIGGVVDCQALTDYAKTLPDVVYSEDNMYTCSENGLNSIKKAIKAYNLNRVVVCSCSPRTHEHLFRQTIEEVGLNKYLFNFVNIRDQCTWVHIREPIACFDKCKDLIKMGVSKARILEPLEDIKIKVTPKSLVIGAGISGISAAHSLSSQGFKTYLVEKEENIGGLLNYLYKIYPTERNAIDLLNELKDKLNNTQNCEIYTSSVVKCVKGFLGNYEVQIKQLDDLIDLKIGVIIVSTGASNFVPVNLYNYNSKTTITQLELESRLKNNDIEAKNIVMIQCVGSRNEYRKYCSTVCCMTALNNALLIKKNNSYANISILFRDLNTPGVDFEDYYKKARQKGIIFIKYSPEKEITVKENKVTVFNEYLGEYLIIPYDLLVLSTPLIAHEDNKDLAHMLKVPLEENGFFLEAHIKLRPVEFATDGLFICGAAKWPAHISECIAQGKAAASRAATVLSHEALELEGATAYIPEWKRYLCTGCNICIRICPFHAIVRDEEGYAYIQEALCKGCGLCGSTCPERAIEIKGFSDEQILAEIEALREM